MFRTRKLFVCVVVLTLLVSVLTWYHLTVSGSKSVSYSVGGKVKSKKKSQGFLASFDFYEQQTQALLNFYQLQCLATHSDMRVAEPFLTGTWLSSFPDHMSWFSESTENAASLGKVYDMDVWNSKLSSGRSYQPVLSWETFKQEAPRQLIVHCIQYHSGKPPKPNDFKNFQIDCSNHCYKGFNKVLSLLQKEGFKEVGRGCTNVEHLAFDRRITIEEFKENVFGDCDPADVTVIFNTFRGFDSIDRKDGMRFPLYINSSCGHRRNLPPNSIVPSALIMKDAEKYYTKVAENVTVGILARIEKIQLNSRVRFTECVEKAVQIKEELYKNHSLKNTFLAMDVGKYGSKSSGAKKVQGNLGKTLFEKLYGKENWTFEEWERMFSTISSSENPAYVANLQRTIAAKATCLILIGGGSFQYQTRRWHLDQFQPDKPAANQCVFMVCEG